MDIVLLTWIAIYITLATVLFNFLRYFTKLKLPSSLILSVSISLLIPRIHISESMGSWFVEYVWFFIVLGILVAAIAAAINSNNKTCDSANETNNQHKKWTIIFHIRKE